MVCDTVAILGVTGHNDSAWRVPGHFSARKGIQELILEHTFSLP